MRAIANEAEIPPPAEHEALRGLARERKAGEAEARKAAERIAIEVEEVLWEAAAERSAAKVAQRAKNETLARVSQVERSNQGLETALAVERQARAIAERLVQEAQRAREQLGTREAGEGEQVTAWCSLAAA